jgi:hypothetical protein
MSTFSHFLMKPSKKSTKSTSIFFFRQDSRNTSDNQHSEAKNLTSNDLSMPQAVKILLIRLQKRCFEANTWLL